MLSAFTSWPSFSHRTFALSRLTMAHSVVLSFSKAEMFIVPSLFRNLSGGSEENKV